MKRPLIAIATLSALTLSVAAPAGAQTLTPRSVAVQTSDLNLASAEGMARLDRRIEKAANKACGVDKSRTGSRIPSTKAKKCAARAVAEAKIQIAEIRQTRQLGG